MPTSAASPLQKALDSEAGGACGSSYVARVSAVARERNWGPGGGAAWQCQMGTRHAACPGQEALPCGPSQVS